jgi:hypothetical protein
MLDWVGGEFDPEEINRALEPIGSDARGVQCGPGERT